MKVKIAFSFVVIFTILLSVGMVAASENMTENDENHLMEDNLQDFDIADDDSYDFDEKSISTDIDDPSLNYVELSADVKADKTSIYLHDNVKWTITVKAVGGSANNVLVIAKLPREFKYMSHSCDAGSYNSYTGIWNVGKLSGNSPKTLTISSKALGFGQGAFIVFAKANSHDADYRDGISFYQYTVYPGIPIVVSKSDDSNRHNSHYLSSYQSSLRSVTKAVSNSTVEAKVDMRPTANPIGMVLLSLMALIGVRLKKR